MLTTREITLGSNEAAEALYFGYCNTNDVALTGLSPSYEVVIDQLVELDDGLDRDMTAYFTERLEPMVEVTPDNVTLLQTALSALQRGENITLPQKQALGGYDDFIDAVIQTSQVTYPELMSDMMIHYLTANGLGKDIEDWINDGGDVRGYTDDRIIYPVYAADAIRSTLDAPLLDEYPNMEGRRRVASMLLIIKTNLAVGALYAAGVDGDTVAAQVAVALDPILRI